MESVFDFLCGIMMTLFWIFRLVIAALVYLKIDIPITIPYLTIEIVMSFVTLVCIVCVFKRKIFGSIFYFVMYVAYFGYDLFVIYKDRLIDAKIENVAFDFVAITLAVVIMLNVLLSKVVRINKKKNTEWFYEGEQYDRNLDERADKNNYRIY